MNEDTQTWRCLCSRENPQDTIDCLKCGKQRWSQLGITREKAVAITEQREARKAA